MQNNISTDRLFLAILTREDHEFMRQLVNSKGWLEFIGDRHVHSHQEAITYIDKILASDSLFYWVVRVKNETTPIGIVSFLKRSYLDNFDIGFAFLPDFNGFGYAYEAAKAILSIASEWQQGHPILATTMPGNVKSIKLLTKLGLHFEKELSRRKETIYVYSNAVDDQNAGNS